MKSLVINNTEAEYPAAEQLVEEFLHRHQINKVTHAETMMVFEALYHNLQELMESSDTAVTISARQRLGDLRISIGFEGGMMDPTESGDELSPEARILEAYYDKIDYNGRPMSPASIGGGFHFRPSATGYNPPLTPGGAEAPGARCPFSPALAG